MFTTPTAGTRRPAARRAVIALTAAGLVTGGMLAGAGQAQAKGGGGGVTASGACSKGGTFKLKAKAENSGIQAEVEIEGRSGQVWRVVVVDNKVTRIDTTAKTVLGVARVSKVIPNMAGTDAISLKATNTVTGSVCSGAVRL